MTKPPRRKPHPDWEPFVDEISDCQCDTCNEVAYARSDVLDFDGRRYREAAAALLAALRAGEHRRMSIAERAELARAAKAERLAAAIAEGASADRIAAIERGYTTVRMSDFYATGMGLGIGPRKETA